jgi:hypothetical protein
MNFDKLVNIILEKIQDTVLLESIYKFVETNKYCDAWDGVLKYDGEVGLPEIYATTIYLNRFKDNTFIYEPISKRIELHGYIEPSTPEHLQPRPKLPGTVKWPSDYGSYERAVEHIKHVVEDRILPYCEDTNIHVDINVQEFIASLTQLIRNLFEPYKWIIGTWSIIAFDAQTITFAVTVDHNSYAALRKADIQNNLKNVDTSGLEDLL